MTPEQLLQDYFSKLSLEDLETMRAILLKYRPPDNHDITARGQLSVRRNSTLAGFVARSRCHL